MADQDYPLMSLVDDYSELGEYDQFRGYDGHTEHDQYSGWKILNVLKGHENAICSLAVLPDGRIASGSKDATIRIWYPDAKEPIKVLKGRSESVTVLVALDGPSSKKFRVHLISGSWDQCILTWDINSDVEEPIGAMLGHCGTITCLALLPDGPSEFSTGKFKERESSRLCGRLASASSDRTIRIWDIGSCEQLKVLESHYYISSLAFLPNGRLVSSSYDATIRFWDIDTGKQCGVQEHRTISGALAVLPKGRLAYRSLGNTIGIRNLYTNEKAKILKGHYNCILSLVVLPNNHLASCAYDGTIRIWDTNTGKQLKILTNPVRDVQQLAVLPDGRLASFSSNETSIEIWGSKRMGNLLTKGTK